MEEMKVDEKEALACCGSNQFAKQMGPSISLLDNAVSAAKDIWFNKVDVIGWLEAFVAHPQIGESPSPSSFLLLLLLLLLLDVIGWLEAFAAHPQIGESPSHTTSAQWSKGEQATATDSGLQVGIMLQLNK
ncbi:hypothetical protein CRYUN_Cryun09bG0120300 [Craigia yunnanensis]